MDFRILGPLEVSDGGRPVQVARPKQRALLAVLLLRAGRVVSVDRLLDDLWGESPPPSARASLQNAVSMLRKLLGPDLLRTQPPGYVLEVDPDRVDALRFEGLVEDARELVPAERAAVLREALGLWRGPALADLAFEPFADVEVERLEELRAAAREELADAELALGRHEAAVPALEAIVAEHPFRERPRALLMLALYRAGRQAEALDAYQTARRFLDDELGLEPGPQLQELQRAILRQDPTLAAPAAPQPPPATPGAERRQAVTVVFADLVDSTALAAELDPEAYRNVLLRWFERARAAIERHGGTVEKFIGDAVVGVFGVPARHEDDALRAVRAAAELADGLERLSGELERSHGVRLRLRAGVNTGDAVVGDGVPLAAGYAINVAAKLEQTAAPGEVLLGPATYRLVRDAVSADAVEPLALGGKAAPLPAFRLTGVQPSAEPIPRRLEAPLVGRRRELAALRTAFDEARRERACRAVTVLGDAGIGKTRLASELAAALGRKATVLAGRCVSYGAGATYLPIAEIVRGLVPDGAEEGLTALLCDDPDAALVARRVRELTGLAKGATPAQEGFWAVRRLLESAARRRPLLVLLEDVHWAEPTLLDLVEHLAGQPAAGPMLILALARPELLETRPGWPVTLTLAPLSEAESGELVDNLPAGTELAQATRGRIVEVAAGNALFAEQLLAHVAETGEEALAVPPSLEGLLAGRLDRLPDGERLTLECAAVLGREFDAGAVEELSGADALAPLAELSAKGLVRETDEGRLGFHHVLVRDVAYAAITKRRRAELHEQAADWLDRRRGPDELVGYHLEQAHGYRVELGPADLHARRLGEEAGARLSKAGARAWSFGDAPAAVNLLARAKRLLPADHAMRPETLRELGSALWAIGDIDNAQATLAAAMDAAANRGDRAAELRTHIELSYFRLFYEPEGEPARFLDVAADAIPVFEAVADHRFLGWTWAALAYVHGGVHGRYAAAEHAAEESLSHYRRLGWISAASVRAVATVLYHGPAQTQKAISRCGELLAEADHGGKAVLWTYLAGLEGMRGRFGVARDFAQRGLQAHEDLGWTVTMHATWAPVAADVETLSGNYSAAEVLLRECCDRLQALRQDAPLASRAAQLADVLYVLGAVSEAEHWIEVAEDATATDDISAHVRVRSVRAKLLARGGSHREAEREAREALRLVEATDALDRRARVLLDLAEVLRLGASENEAARHVEAAVLLFEQKGNRAAAGEARALLADLTPA